MSEQTNDTTANDTDHDATKAGRRLAGNKLAQARAALVSLAELVKWAAYEDAPEPDTDAEADDDAEGAMDDEDEKALDVVDVSVKAIGTDRVRGPAILWGHPGATDITREYFARDTAETDAIFKAIGKLPLLYHHGADDALKTAVVGVVDALDADDTGLWFEAQLTASNKYRTAIDGLIARGALGVSSGTLPRARKVAPDGKITRWPIAEISLTPTPAEPRMMDRPVAAIKAAYTELGLTFPDDAQATGAEDARRAVDLEFERLNILKLR